jgi:hypothetical protein
MSLTSKYKTINKQTYSKGDFTVSPPTHAGYTASGTFKGLIQAPKPNSTFNNGKSTINVDAILFCSEKEVFTDTDIVEYKSVKYKVGNSTTQTDGVSGIIPKRGQHSEYSLMYTQEGI